MDPELKAIMLTDYRRRYGMDLTIDYAGEAYIAASGQCCHCQLRHRTPWTSTYWGHDDERR